ncbi:MAG: NAD synthetase [Gammaproteobacteria bacterium]|nr:NAD synthetase [Gammaproteobacteria bacterium]
MADYTNQWVYKGNVFDSDDIGNHYGFVYRITNNTTGKSYIGRKYFVQKRKPKGGKRRVTSESNWKKYYGSSEELKQDIGSYGRDNFRREILSLHSTIGKTNYEETRQLFLNDVLTEKLTDGTPAYYNSNILGRYYRKDYF